MSDPTIPAGTPTPTSAPGSAGTPAGWYPDTTTPGRLRWWDGSEWTQQYAPDPAVPIAPKAKVPIWLRVVGIVLILGVFAVIAVMVVNAVTSSTSAPATAIRAYNQAWWNADCTAYEATTTPAFRDGFVDDQGEPYSCAVFEAQADIYYAGNTDLQVRITSSEISGTSATIEAAETGRNDEGLFQNDWIYEMVLVGDVWLVDSEIIVEE